ncbi:4-alpha-glucanotransferase [Aeromicrobium wangtongii]|uniref:4-alpha-glucanotransferase n=1 Tax=Aeromicrobium wangtongii TaxID=2969247 RepID=A0ABY5MDJ2_9ACTN|nr:4-alpha-glucanotransferase [Aeromicrobium wangtongii]MCD9199213.1 4-alpha-glucanotransferase [Aeromicrobium wangtongii]UUP15527.1 4-alpha-glucanotransferase [Aeromicrobium wangtongii]
MSPELVELAHAHGVATEYEGSDRTPVVVDEELVVAVLGMLEVDATTPESVRAALADVREQQRRTVLPPTVVALQGRSRPLGVAARVELEDGSSREVGDELPDDLPLGWHRIVTDEQDVTLIVAPERMPDIHPTWGWMLQLYALRSEHSWGMGDFGDLAEFARRSGAEQGAGVILVNPVQAVAPAHPIQRSPYSPASRRFANPLYLRVTDTAAYAAADPATQAAVLALAPQRNTELIDYDAVWDAKHAALELLWPHRPADEQAHEPDDQLRDFATFCALAEQHGDDWRDWPASLQDPTSTAVTQVRVELAERIAFHAWLQLLCREQLDAARAAAHGSGMGVGIVHDLPVGVSAGGPDTWSQREVFAPVVRVGCPADAFNELGQDWGLPPFKPAELAAAGYAPFRDVVRSVLQHADGIRIDHIAGLWRLWWIPPGEPAHRGTYVHYDADAMLAVLALEAHRAGAIIVGEDLGTVEDVVTTTMHERGMLSSAVLWFERDWDAPGQPFERPADWEPETMASVTTHDLPTATGWLEAEHVRLRASLDLLDGSAEDAYAAAASDRAALMDLVAAEGITDDDPVVALHAVIARAASRLVLSAPTDVLGERRQPNLPGTIDQYPNWRIPLPVSLEEFFDDAHVRAVIAPLRAERPPSAASHR